MVTNGKKLDFYIDKLVTLSFRTEVTELAATEGNSTAHTNPKRLYSL